MCCDVVSNVNISQTLTIDRWIDGGKKKDNDKSKKYKAIYNIVKPFNNYNYNYNYNKLQHLSIPLPFLPISPSSLAASLFSCKESKNGNKEKDIRMSRSK